MSFKIIKQKFGTSAKTTIFELETEIKVNDFCFVGERGFVVAMDNGVALLTPQNIFESSWVKNINNPKAITFNKRTKMFYVVERCSVVKKFNLDSLNVTEVMGRKNKEDFNKYFSKMREEDKENSIVDCSVDRGQVYVVNNNINRCLNISSSTSKVLVGDGRRGFSIASKLEACRLNKPNGVCCYDGDIYIADTGNSCVRRISKGKIKTVLGQPGKKGELLSEPSKMVIKDGLLYFIDGNRINYSSLNTDDIGTLYKSEERIVSLDVDDDKFLYILKEI